ncbi:hypothetical protein [Gordonia polyisoprenivorans]|uniref:hypothetical protein n=1 Tax=Gordonia polyisoprenivorans TaxID=84595 RepID=UPI001AD659A8|nr:hypothetical protein [Gordonia polyisoprenivorans]QTI71117.1 hypothetical protein J6U32_11675 [Gordonia polyisoprenivorans]
MEHESVSAEEATGVTSRAGVSVDIDEVIAVADFYRKTSQVLAVAAGDLDEHRFGTWAADDDDHAELAGRFTAISRVLTERLRDQSESAAALSKLLTRGLAAIDAADDEAARGVSAAAAGAESDG